MKKVAIMGFGRIGRDVLRISMLNENDSYEITHIADLNAKENINKLLHLFKYDTIYRRFPKEAHVEGDNFVIDGKKIQILDGKNPQDMDWASLGVDIVIDSTGAFTQREKAQGHLDAGAKKVIITAPAKQEDITIVMGVNDKDYDPEKHNIISNASCTTNCLAPITKVMVDNFKIVKGFMTTVHAYTNDQKIHDSIHKDMRRARMGAENIVPTTTGAAEAVAKVLPEVKDILTGMAMRVPVPTGSLVDVTFELDRNVTKEEINELMKKASETELKGILDYTDEDYVSSDIVGDPHSSIFDSKLTLVKDNLVKLVSWYDNEWGYSNRVCQLTKMVADK